MSTPIDALIAGAGPAGSATAAHLAGRGYRVVVVDRAAFPRDKACSEYLGPEALRLLDELGVVGNLEQAGAQPLFGTTVIAARGAALTGLFSRTAVRPYRDAGLSVSRRILDNALVNVARRAGADVRERLTAEELLYESGAVAGLVVRDAAGVRHTIRARLTIGADGLRSLVARRIGRRHYGFPARLAFVAHLANVSGLEGIAEMHVGERGYVGLNRISPGLANVALVIPRGHASAARGDVTRYFLSELERFPAVRDRVSHADITREVLVTGPFAAWSGRVVVNGALLVGDAADFFDPFTGEGIYSALKGAELAAQTAASALANGGIPSSHQLAGYRLARRATFLGKWMVERMVGYGMLAPALFDRAVARLERRGLGHTFVGVTGDYVPARAVLNPWFLSRMVL